MNIAFLVIVFLWVRYLADLSLHEKINDSLKEILRYNQQESGLHNVYRYGDIGQMIVEAVGPVLRRLLHWCG